MPLEDLLKKHRQCCTDPKLELIEKAYRFAEAAHVRQKRRSGEPYINHCLRVAEILVEMKVDSYALAAALLHDVLEHTDFAKQDLEAEFGSVITNLVEGTTYVKKLKTDGALGTSRLSSSERMRKLILVTAKDGRATLIRLAEKLHNLETLDAVAKETASAAANKALKVYAPLADRLGAYHLKWQIEDKAFRFINPGVYWEIVAFLNEEKARREAYLHERCLELEESLSKEGIKAKISGRTKHVYSIFKKQEKLLEEGISENNLAERLCDLHGIRVLVSEKDDCYRILSSIQNLWKPVQKFFEDYIINPKPNGYQSLHTIVLGPDKKRFEVQIRTFKMHEYNEFGPASHVFYKEVGKRYVPATDKFGWLRHLVGWKGIEANLFGNYIFVFTPKGDVIELPKGSTPVDFAYKVHSEIGDCCLGALVDGKQSSLQTQLENGQMVKIVTSKILKKPSLDWLGFVNSETKVKIRSGLKNSEG